MGIQRPFIKYRQISIPDAYHGTDKDAALSVVENKNFNPSSGQEHYLGEGVYFFEGSDWHAEDWAKRKVMSEGLKDYGVVQANIVLGRCLDFNNGAHRRLLKSFAQMLEDRGVKNLTDAVVIECIGALCKKDKGIDTVRATYCQPEKGTIHGNSRFYFYTAPLLCVKNIQNITQISLYRTGTVQ